jgi:hypothetical protein
MFMSDKGHQYGGNIRNLAEAYVWSPEELLAFFKPISTLLALRNGSVR